MVTPDRDKERTGAVAGQDEPGPAVRDTPEPDAPRAPEATAEPTKPAAPARPAPLRKPTRIKQTRISSTWVAVIVAVIVLIFFLIFILQNLDSVTVHFLGAAGTLPLGVALLFAGVGGALVVVLIGTARIMQLRRVARRAGITRRR
ncbi:MAG TPA: lipopolysaccharide assembly protein LapA domain-containing protein [Pseudonocardiaceae bacterium]|jgi:uncharacterized integral membrane protein|nr:lipopolysaccharide assembly protein LapA domain-containing protein [Pseudonocardiaceae bacterium]